MVEEGLSCLVVLRHAVHAVLTCKAEGVSRRFYGGALMYVHKAMEISTLIYVPLVRAPRLVNESEIQFCFSRLSLLPA
jgi:hypothetical protein